MYLVSFIYPHGNTICEQRIENRREAEDYVKDLQRIGCKVWIRHINF